jgi:putative drug exporter of the RND superfamily
LQITQPWYRGFARPGLVLRWISRLGETLDRDAGVGTIRLDARTDLAELAPLERAVTLAAVAIAERPRVLMIEQADGVSVDGEFLRAIARLAPASTTIVVATNAAAVRLDIDRQLITVDLDVAGSERAHPTHQSLVEGSLS